LPVLAGAALRVETVAAHLKQRGHISEGSALIEYGRFRLADVIHRLRNDRKDLLPRGRRSSPSTSKTPRELLWRISPRRNAGRSNAAKWSKQPAHVRHAGLASPTAMSLAFMDALRKGLRGSRRDPMPILTMPVWTGPRDHEARP
jgi:hypothetical protein